jgi:putative transposase
MPCSSWLTSTSSNRALRQAPKTGSSCSTESCTRQNIEPGQLIIHADRGSAMRSKTLAQTMASLGVTKSHSRPHVSDDNPFSESQFKTLKYRPDFPARFDSLMHSEMHGQDFFPWYNEEHHHVALGLMTPHDIHYGLAQEKWTRRAEALAAKYAAHPERFPRGLPTPPPAAHRRVDQQTGLGDGARGSRRSTWRRKCSI